MRKILALTVLCLAPSLAAASVLPFVQDNYGVALSQAKQRNVPIFVEAWAPW